VCSGKAALWIGAVRSETIAVGPGKAWFKRRILHAPNLIAELSACKMRSLNQMPNFNSSRLKYCKLRRLNRTLVQ